MKKIGYDCRNIQIGSNRAPVWPEGIVGSISHTADTAYAAIATKEQHKYIGIDIEYFVDKEMRNSIQERIINHNESRLLQESELADNCAFTLAFSAKESLFKAIQKEIGSFFDFSAAEITKIDQNASTFNIKLCDPLSPIFYEGRSFTGSFVNYSNSMGVLEILCHSTKL